MKHFFLAAGTLWQRELVRFFRQRSRVIGALGPPVLFWFLIGSGLGGSFQFSPVSAPPGTAGINYMQYFFPGTITLIVLFTAIFSTISIIEDRHEGFLQSVMVAPISRSAIVLGKIAGGTTLGVHSRICVPVLLPAGGHFDPSTLVCLSSDDAAFNFLRSDRVGVCHCLEAGFNAGISCDHESGADSDVALIRSALSDFRRALLAAPRDAREPAFVRRRRLERKFSNSRPTASNGNGVSGSVPGRDHRLWLHSCICLSVIVTSKS